MKVSPSSIERIPLYVRVFGALKIRIHSQEWKNGDCIPSIEELCALYSVSRNTMRQALELLRQEGLIESTRGRGTFVVHDVGDGKIDQAIIDAINNPFLEDGRISIKVLSRTRRAPLPDHIAGGHRSYADYTRIQKLHVHEGIPFGFIDIYVATESYDKLPKRTDERQLLSKLLPAYAGVSFTSWWEEITIGYADERIASLLEYSMLNPLVLVTRRRLDKHEKVVLGGHFHFRGDTFVLRIGGKGPRVPHSTMSQKLA